MIKDTSYTITNEMLIKALDSIPNYFGKSTLNQPTGNFFTDKWTIKPEFLNSVWDTIMQMLPFPVGEARIISIEPGKCYIKHADIDDRYHLTLQSEDSFLVDLDKNILHPLHVTKVWKLFDAGVRHSAVNFGTKNRIELVVRKLLPKVENKNFCKVIISTEQMNHETARNKFDNTVSPWLNAKAKQNLLQDFNFTETQVTFKSSKESIQSLKELLPSNFILKVLDE